MRVIRTTNQGSRRISLISPRYSQIGIEVGDCSVSVFKVKGLWWREYCEMSMFLSGSTDMFTIKELFSVLYHIMYMIPSWTCSKIMHLALVKSWNVTAFIEISVDSISWVFEDTRKLS